MEVASIPSRFRVRRVFRGLVLTIARPLARAGVRPDTISFVGVFIALAASLSLILFQSSLLFGLLVFVTGLLDGVDGAVARETGSASESGAFTDSVLDKVSEILLLLGIMLAFSGNRVLGLSIEVWVLLAVSGWLMTSYTRARAESLGVQDLDIGLAGRSERLLILVVFSILGYLLWGLVTVSLVAIGTAAYRAFHYGRQLRKKVE